jgi:tRNA (guanine-N7-)-methyltransferase
MRLRNIADAKKRLGQYPELATLAPALHRGQWKVYFGNDNPVFLEIGTGKGQFICGISEQMPNINFLGLEKYDSVLLRALQKLTAAPRRNVFLLRGEAENLLEYFDAGEIGRVYLNFSDPWPRKCNMNRRLTHVKFLDKYRFVLAPEGEIHIKTDNRGFFEFTLTQINEYGMKIDYINLDLHAQEPECNVRTEYETSRAAGGATIYGLVCRFR